MLRASRQYPSTRVPRAPRARAAVENLLMFIAPAAQHGSAACGPVGDLPYVIPEGAVP